MSTPTALRPAVVRLLQCQRAPPAAALAATSIPPAFLLPSLLRLHRAPPSTQCTSSPFSTSSRASFPRDHNRERGVSTTRRTGPRQPLSVSKTALPRPALDPAQRSRVAVDEDHGLWGFFHSKDKPLNTPEEDHEHGRPWCVEELRGKSWEDLHALWWVCCKERNRIATESFERKRIDAGYGDHESQRRDVTVRRTQRAIKHVLTERYYSWRDAEELAREDPEIDLSGIGPTYIPSDLEEEAVLSEPDLEYTPEHTPEQPLEQTLEPDVKPEVKATPIA